MLRRNHRLKSGKHMPQSVMLKLLERHRGQGRRIAHSTLREFNDLGGDEPCSRIVSQSEVQFGAHAFERERHLPDEFRFKCLSREERSYWHGSFGYSRLPELCTVRFMPWLNRCRRGGKLGRERVLTPLISQICSSLRNPFFQSAQMTHGWIGAR
jgi:hypothetical protein